MTRKKLFQFLHKFIKKYLKIFLEFNRPQDWNNDIALLKLDKPVKFNDKISPLCLPSENVCFKEGKKSPRGPPLNIFLFDNWKNRMLADFLGFKMIWRSPYYWITLKTSVPNRYYKLGVKLGPKISKNLVIKSFQ